MIQYQLQHIRRHSEPYRVSRKLKKELKAKMRSGINDEYEREPSPPLPEVDETSNGPEYVSTFRQYLPQVCAVMVKNILLLAYGMTLGFPTIVIPAVQGGSGQQENHDKDLSLSTDEISWFSSINLIVVPIGCIFSGAFTQPIGRRRAMQIISLPILISWLLFHYASNVLMLYAGLILSGLSGGLMEAPVLTYVAEVTQPAIRGALSGTGSLFIIIGVTVQFLLGTFLNWREVALWSMAFPVIAFVLLFFIPESPYWLLLKKRYNDAQLSLAWLRGWVQPTDVQKEFEGLRERIESNILDSHIMHDNTCMQRSRAFQRRSFIVPLFLVSITFFIGHFSGMTTLQTYAVQIFNTLKAPIDKYMATLLLGVVEILGAAICIGSIHYTGKRPLALISTIGCGVCFLLTATYAHFLTEIPGHGVANIISNVSAIDLTAEFSNSSELFNVSLSQNGTTMGDNDVSGISIFIPLPDEDDTNTYAWIPLTLLLSSALLSHAGIRLLPWILIGEVFPSNVRAAGAGFASGMGYIGGFLANKFFLNMLSAMTLPGTFWFYSAVSLLGAGMLYFILPETEGRTLLEIEDHFTGKRSLDKKDHERQKKISTTSRSTVGSSKKVSRIDPPRSFQLNVNKWDANKKFEQQLQTHDFNPREILDTFKKGDLMIAVPSSAVMGSKKPFPDPRISGPPPLPLSSRGHANLAFEHDKKEVTYL